MDKQYMRSPLAPKLQARVQSYLDAAKLKGVEVRVPEAASEVAEEVAGIDDSFEVNRAYVAQYMRGQLKKVDKLTGLPIWLRIGAVEIEQDDDGEEVTRDTSYYKITRTISAEELTIGTRDLVRRVKGPLNRIVALWWFAKFSHIIRYGDRSKALWLDTYAVAHLVELALAYLEKISNKRGEAP